MKVTSTGIANGYWEDRFGKFGTELSAEGTPLRSIPFKIEDAPEGTVSFAVVLDDVDAIPVCGFTWIHWALCDLTVYALDCKLNLKPGFYLNELIHGLRGHVLSHTRLSAMYRAK